MRTNDNDMWNEQSRVSQLGTPVYCFCQLQTGDSTVVLDTVLAEISQSKNIVTTLIAGRNGSVKESFGSDDYKIKLQGAITNNGNDYPLKEVQSLLKILQSNDVIAISGGFFRLFGIFNVVITDYSLPQSEGLQNTQMFEISMLSDTPIELILNGNAL